MIIPNNLEICLRITSSFFEILGVFFLSVEAIKLQNFCLIRDRIIRPILARVLHKIPFITTMFAIGMGGAFLILLLKYNSIVILLEYFVESISPKFPGPDPLIFFLVSILLIGLTSWAGIIIGYLLYFFSVGIIQLFIILFNTIEKHTPKGTIGIIGFLFFLTGFIIRTYIDLSKLKWELY